MIEIIGEIRDATEEEIKEYESKQNTSNWKDSMMRTFLGSRYEKNK